MEKAFKTYFGGKNSSGVYQQIINEIRPHTVYMELFAGNAAIYRYKKPAQLSVLNDIDKAVSSAWIAKNLTNTEVYNVDTIAYLKRVNFADSRRYCLYLDPPYPLDSRRSNIEVYNYEMTDNQHRELLQLLLDLPPNVDVLISTYENKLYKEYLSNWRVKTFTGQTRQGPATEYLYMNYQNRSGVLHDYNYIGQNFTDRQRIKRKIYREVEKLKALPAAERYAIISQLMSSFSIDENDFTGVGIHLVP